MKKLWLATLISAALALSISINSFASESIKGKVVAFIPKLTGNAFFESANIGAQEYAKKTGFIVEYMGSSEATVDDQIEVLNAAVQRGVDAICISSVDAKALDEKLLEIKKRGITVTTWDSDVSGNARSIMVSQGTPVILGKRLIDMAAESLIKRGVDPKAKAVKYVWHYSQASVADQNSWQVEGEKYVKAKYPNWINVAPENYYSNQEAEKAIAVGINILEEYPDIDVIICNDSTALPGQLIAIEEKGLDKTKITITGYASPMAIKPYAKADLIEEWGLWDCGLQGAMGTYMAAYLASGNTVKVGDEITIPYIGKVKILPNDSLVEGAKTLDTNNGVILVPELLIFTKDNVDKFYF